MPAFQYFLLENLEEKAFDTRGASAMFLFLIFSAADFWEKASDVAGNSAA